MKQIPAFLQTLVNTCVAVVLVFALFSMWQAQAPALPAASAALAAEPASAQAAAPVSGAPAAQTASTCDSGRSVHVSGSASINIVPDRALIQLGVQTNGSSPSAVQSANAAAIQDVMRSLQALGVPAKDIATDWYIIEPVYDDYTSLYIKGYRIYNLVAITLREVDKTSKVIAAALEAGANQVVNVEFYTSELRKYRDQARELAMKAAVEKAEALAGAAGAQTGCVMQITENTWSYYNGWWWGRSQNQMTQNTVQNAAPASGSGDSSGSQAEPVSLGTISIKAEVGVTYELK